MHILACYKIVPDDQDIYVNADQTLGLDKAVPKISQYDLNAIQAGLVLARSVPGGTLTGLSAGGKKYLENSKSRKDALSRGLERLELVIDDSLEKALPGVTAQVLARAAQTIGFDVIVCGEGSGDLYAQQVGTLLGEYLDVPNITAVSRITIENGECLVERTLEKEVEVLVVPLPAVLSVTTDINEPPVPSMKAILEAGKKPVAVHSLADLEAAESSVPVHTVSMLAPKQAERLQNIIAGCSDEQIAAFVDAIRPILAG